MQGHGLISHHRILTPLAAAPLRRTVIGVLALSMTLSGPAIAVAVPRTNAAISDSVLEQIGHGYVYNIDANLNSQDGPVKTVDDLKQPRKITVHHKGVPYTTYQSRITDKTRQAIEELEQKGFTLMESRNDRASGFQAMVLKHESGKTVIAFRGTDIDKSRPIETAMDLLADTGRIGHRQYFRNRAVLDRWAEEYPNSIVTGHSLGGALGQRFVTDHPHTIDRAVLFNAPGVEKNVADRFRNEFGGNPPSNLVTYYQVLEDLVSEYGGEEHLPGSVKAVFGPDVSPYRKDKFLAEHTGHKLQPGSNTRVVDIPFDAYERNRGRKDQNGRDQGLLKSDIKERLYYRFRLQSADQPVIPVQSGPKNRPTENPTDSLWQEPAVVTPPYKFEKREVPKVTPWFSDGSSDLKSNKDNVQPGTDETAAGAFNEADVLDAIAEFEKDNPTAKGKAYKTGGSRTWQRQLDFILERDGSYPNIQKRFKEKFNVDTLPSSRSELTKEQLDWWEDEIMKQAGKSPGFPHVGGKAMDVSVRNLSLAEKKKLLSKLEEKGFDVLLEDVNGNKSKYRVPIEDANVFHVSK